MQGYDDSEIETRTQQRPWECGDCGIVHTHYKGVRHSLRGMAVGPAFVLSELEYNPDCHCGIHEMAEKAKAGDVALPSGLQDHIVRMDQHLVLPQETEQSIAEVVENE